MATSKKLRKAKKQQKILERQLARYEKGALDVTNLLDELEVHSRRKAVVQQESKIHKTVIQESSLPTIKSESTVDISNKTRKRQLTKALRNKKATTYIKHPRISLRKEKEKHPLTKAQRSARAKKAYKTRVSRMTEQELKEYNKKLAQQLKEGNEKRTHEQRSKASKKAQETFRNSMSESALKEHYRRASERAQATKERHANDKQLAKQLLDELQDEIDNVNISNDDDFVSPTISQAPYDDSVIDRLKDKITEIANMTPITKPYRTGKQVEEFDLWQSNLWSLIDDITISLEVEELNAYLEYLYTTEEQIAKELDDFIEAYYAEDTHKHLEKIISLLYGRPLTLKESTSYHDIQEAIDGEQ